MIITDSQVHVWEPHRPDRPWPAASLAAGPGGFLSAPGARPHRARPIEAGEMVAMMDDAGVQRAIVVPPSPAGDSNATALEAVAKYPDRFRVMGRFDPKADDAREQLQGWKQQPGMLGIRMTFHRPQWRTWLSDGSIDWFWGEAEKLGIPVMLLAPGQTVPLAAVARRHPGLQLIADHMAVHSAYRDTQCEPDIQAICELATLPNVSVKASAVPCYTDDAFPFRAFDGYLERIYDAFGPRRMFWGSDVSRLPCTYREAVQHFLQLDFMPQADKELVMGKALSEKLGWA